MKICFLITTYHRQESCQRLVNSLQGLGDIVVIKDGYGYNITGCTHFEQQPHLGKPGYFQTVNKLFARRTPADYYIMLPDDFLMTETQINRAIAIWQSITDTQKICLNLYADRIGIPCWTKFPPTNIGIVMKTQWVDMCFLCTPLFFNVVGVIPPPPKRWCSNPKRSSGVGRHISLQLYGMGFTLCQVFESLVEPQPEHNKRLMVQ